MSRKKCIKKKQLDFSSDFFLSANELVSTLNLSKIQIKKLKLLQARKLALQIPASIFVKELSPFQSICKFLSEKGMKPSEISRALVKPYMDVYMTLKNAQKKHHKKLSATSSYNIPLSSLIDSKLTLSEALVFCLRDTYALGYAELGRLLKRDRRVIWSLYDRANKKRGDKK